MTRYIVNVVVSGRSASLLIVLPNTALVLDLVDKVKARLLGLKLGITSTTDLELTPRINSVDGPILDTEDLLLDALPDSTKEQLFVVIGSTEAPDHSTVPKAPSSGPSKAQQKVRLRVITPSLARRQPSIDSIPLLPEDAITLNSTLVELQAQVKEHLGLPAGEDILQHAVCNCAFARQIDENTVLNELNNNGPVALYSFVVVYGMNQVTLVPVDAEPTKQSLLQAAEDHLGSEVSEHKHFIIGGLEDPTGHGTAKYIKLPVLAFCASKTHDGQHPPQRTTASNPRTVIMDLHTAEMPIRITSGNANLTLLAVGLEDCLVDGILNIYAVKRSILPDSKPLTGMREGKDAIFAGACGSAWEHPLGQSDRGLANLLSSMRVFWELSTEMEDPGRDAVLHIIYLLTHFPPAVRGFFQITQSQTPSECERAAISQCLYEVLKDVVPLQMIKSDPTRLFEGARLLFGLILDKAKRLKTPMHDQEALPEALPYVNAMKVQELRNMITMEAAVAPVQTMSGLVDRGFYEAFQVGGPLRWRNQNDITAINASDRQLQRAALLTGGSASQVVAFDIDMVSRGCGYLDQEDIDKVIYATEYSDLHYLATLCSQNKLGVIPPSSLPSSDKDVLTLDHQGLLAVYVGREACAEAGRDISIFSPTSSPCVSAVDVSIVTQVLVPILNQRNANGTSVFEAFGDRHRAAKPPDEIVMLVVDCSASMEDRCGFIDVEANEDAFSDDVDPDSVSDNAGPIAEDTAYELPSLVELKEFITTHESFSDMLAIVRSGRGDFHRTQNAGKVLTLLGGLAELQIQQKSQELDNARQRNTGYYYRQQAQTITRDLATLRNQSLRMKQYKDLLAAFLLYRAENDTFDEPLIWNIGDTVIPRVYRNKTTSCNMPILTIPLEFLCPISSQIMEDPVTTSDQFVFQRSNIVRWFKAHETSPFTNLKLASLELRPSALIKQNILAWCNSSDIISQYPKSSSSPLVFKSPLEKKTKPLPQSITMNDLYQVAFRITQGRYPNFELHQRNALLYPNDERASLYLSNNHDIFITPLDSAAVSSSNEVEEMCLVKIYCDTNSSAIPITSYWEPRTTTKSLASALFRFYRKAFQTYAWTQIDDPLVVWTVMKYFGDSKVRGRPRNHWESIASFFNRQNATGVLNSEPVWDKADSDEQETRSYDEQPLVLKLYLKRPSARRKNKRTRTMLTRLDLEKAMWDAWINRLLAYNFQSHIGLVTIRSSATLDQEITHAVENFRHQLNSITASGDTALWDAIALAADRLRHYQIQYPNAKLRIVALSDGEDTSSKQQVHSLSMRLMEDKVLLDSICLGTAKQEKFKTLAWLTGGYIFCPQTMEEAMAICEMEPVLSQLERPDIVLPVQAHRYLAVPSRRFNDAKSKVRVNRATRDEFPERKDHPGLSEVYVELGQFSRVSKFADRSNGNLRLSRIHNEIRNSGVKIHPHYDVYICENSFNLWKIVMQGPPDSSYASGTFLMYLDLGVEYPRAPPEGRFITPVYHPNINRHGRICHSILDRNWTVETSCKDVIDSIYSLLLTPEFGNPVNTLVTLDFHWDEVQFKEEVEKHIARHATKTRAQWKTEILGQVSVT